MWIARRATERPVTVVMFFVAIGMFGLVSLSRLNVNLLPDLAYPTLTVRTELTGGAPIEIESLLTKPIEEAVGTIKNVRNVTSVSRSGRSDVTIQFAWGTDMNLASVDTREKLDVLSLPLESDRPLLLRFDPSSEPVMRLALRTPTLDAKPLDETTLKMLRHLAEEEIKDDLEGIAGVAAVKVSGGLDEEIQVYVDQGKLAQLRLSIESVADSLRAENVNLSGGRLEQGNQRYLVRTVNEFQSVNEFRNAVIANVDGRAVYLRDVATVTRGYKEREAITRIDGTEAVELALYKEGDANTVQVAKRVIAELERIDNSLDEDLELTVVQNQATFIESAIDQVVLAAVAGGLLAVLVLYGFLRDARATFIIGLAIPVSIVGTFALMHLSGTSLNIMSLGGIALAIGLLVDNSIVVLENIVRQRELGQGVLASAQQGAGEVAGAVTAATLTTVAVFFPLAFVTGIAGQLFKDQALTVTFALIFSLMLALVLIPMLAAAGGRTGYLEAADRRPPGRAGRTLVSVVRLIRSAIRWIGRVARWLLSPLTVAFAGLNRVMARVYAPLLRWSLGHRAIVVVAALAIFAASLLLVPRLGTELIPQLAQGEFSLNMKLSPGTPLAVTDETVLEAWRTTRKINGVEQTYSVAGTGNRIDASPVDAGEHTATLSVRLAPGAGRAVESAAIEQIRTGIDTLAGVQYDFSRPQLLSLATPLEIVVGGYDLERLTAATERVHAAILESDRFTDVRSSVEGGNPEIQIEFDQDRAARLGLSTRDIAERVVSNVRGNLATRYTWRDTKIDVSVRSVDTRDSSLAELRNLIVNPDSERPVSLDDVATIELAVGPAEIRRLDQQRVGVVSANIAYGDLGTAAAAARDRLARIALPPDVTVDVLGQSDDMQDSLASMQFAMLLAVFLVYLVMASQFESLVHPLVIMMTIPLALVGAVLALFVTGTSINVVAFIGVIMLVGIVVNNAIVLIDLINQLRSEGALLYDAIIAGARARLRPILMTTLTTALGLVPMAIGFGDGAEVRAPMAVTVIGGLMTSTLLTLVVVPVVYSILDREPLRPHAAKT